MKKIGIFGGTFDPLHNGHLFLADLVLQEFQLDEVVFMPLNQPTYKHQPDATPEQRLMLLRKAIQNQPGFVVSDLEQRRGGVTYTVDTLQELHKEEAADYYFIIGSDTLPELPKWRKIGEIFRLCTIICILRPHASEDVEMMIKKYRRDYDAKILTLQVMGKDISSTEVRDRIERGEDFADIVPAEIYQDIKEIYTEQTIDD